MKTKLLLLLTIPLLLASCQKAETNSSSLSSSEDNSEYVDSSENSKENTSSEEELHIDKKMVGTWYITSSSMGILPVNGIFEIFSNDTLAIGSRTLNLQSLYAVYEGAFEFVYGTIHFIASYDEDKNGIDWGYINGTDQDFGFAESQPITQYDYEGEDYPMDKINEYLGTTGNVPAYEASYYYLDLYESSLYDGAKSADLEIRGASAETTAAYISKLIGEGYTFSTFTGSVTDRVFYHGYDPEKMYSLRIVFFKESTPEECEADIFFYNFNTAITEVK